MALGIRSNVGVEVGSAVDTNILVTKPTNAVEGDKIYAVVASGFINGTFTAPDGSWTLIGDQNGISTGGQHVAVYEKTAGPSEPSSYTFTQSDSTNSWTSVCFALFGDDTPTVYGEDDGEDAGGPDLATAEVTTTADGDWLISMFSQDQTVSDGAFDPEVALTEIAESWGPSQIGLAVYRETVATASAQNHAVTQNGGGDNTRTASWIIFAVHDQPVVEGGSALRPAMVI